MKTMKLATKIFLAVVGVLLAAAGIVCLANPLGAVSTVAWLIGLVLLVSGIGTDTSLTLTGLLFGKPEVSQFLLAEMRLQQTLADIFKIITDAAGLEIRLQG